MKKNFGDRKLSEFSVARAYFNILCSFIGIGFIFPFILTVIGKFFLLQYFEKIHLFKIPVKYFGLGEGVEDLQVFRRKEFVDSLFGE